MKHLALAMIVSLIGSAAAAQERKGDTIEFKLDQNIVFVKCTINGEGPFNFIFDTGASITVIKPALAEKLGLRQKAVVEGEGGFLETVLDMVGLNPKLTTVDSIALGKAEVKDFEAVVMNVPQADIPLTLAGKTYDGLIGYHFISRFVTTIDYKKTTIKLEPNDYDPGPAIPQLEGLAPKKPAAKAAAEGKPYLGFSYRTVGDDEANEVGVEGGIVVGALVEDGPAAKAGLKKGDVILETDGKRVRSADDWRTRTARLKIGQELKLLILREKKEQTISVKVGKR